MKTISEALRTAIRRSDQTIYAISQATNVQQTVIWKFLSGERTLTLVSADRLARYFGLELKTTKKGGSYGK